MPCVGRTWFLAAKWGQYIPSKPRIVISNLTPSLAANNFLWKSEPNGLILIYNATAPIQSSTDPNANYKASGFEVIGAPVARNAVWMINGEALPYNDITEAMGASGPTLIAAGSAPTPQELTGVSALGNFLLADWLNLPYKFKLVASTGTEQELLMIKRGDTNNFTAGSVWYQLPQRRPGWISSGFHQTLHRPRRTRRFHSGQCRSRRVYRHLRARPHHRRTEGHLDGLMARRRS